MLTVGDNTVICLNCWRETDPKTLLNDPSATSTVQETFSFQKIVSHNFFFENSGTSISNYNFFFHLMIIDTRFC